ncbi:MAG: YggT family protein [Gammaproteobacteria bacterium]|nr:MAG: YggT family protein [Gammaproteobacteria bacterium]
MGGAYLSNPMAFLINTLFGLYILTFMLRFLLQLVRADFYNPLSQFLVKVTNPLLVPARRIIPGWGGLDVASIAIMLILQMIAQTLVILVYGASFTFMTLLIMSIAQLVSLVLNIFFVTIIIQVILSWVSPNSYNPVVGLLYSLSEPLLRPARRLIPPIGGMDLSPIVVLIFIQLLQMLILPPLQGLLR